ncbi:sigma-70 family RNA polymerase sigma factor [Actinoplanes sp. NPDC051851]|uniref:sigma-70 family RNA polymerase sigma factor n=1 Tax=Actinoplanes sp. NPDC051851 TaxID=3154753 RepID=UPI0034470C34
MGTGQHAVAEDADEAYSELVAQHREAVRAYARRLTGSYGLADDVLQETLLRAWRHRHSLHERDGSLRGWLLTVAHNIAVDQMRRRRPCPVTDEVWSSFQPPVPDHADAAATNALLRPALRRLTAEHRLVLFELYYRCSTVAETAKRFGVPPGTVKSRAHYAVRALRAELAA